MAVNKVERHYNLEDVRKYVTSGVNPPGLTLSQKKSLRKYAKSFTIVDDKLMYKENDSVLRLAVLNEAEKEDVFLSCHADTQGSHFGVVKTMAKISSLYYWLGIKAFVIEHIQNCCECQQDRHLKALKREPEVIESKSAPWEKVRLDLIGPFPESAAGKKYVLLLTCLFSRWVMAFPLRGKTPPEVAKKLTCAMYTMGPPYGFVTNLGQEFVDELNSCLFEEFNVRHFVAQTNGNRLRTNRTFKRRIHLCVPEESDTWDKSLKVVAYSLNTTRHCSTNFTPYEIMFGRRNFLFCEVEWCTGTASKPEASDEDIKHHIKTLGSFQESVKEKISIVQTQIRKRYERQVSKRRKSTNLAFQSDNDSQMDEFQEEKMLFCDSDTDADSTDR